MKKKILYGTLFVVGISIGAYAQSRVSGIWIRADGYANWGNTRGSEGYGIRDNSGTMEYKNSDGDWGVFAAAGNPGGSSGQVQFNNSSVFGGTPLSYDGTRFNTATTFTNKSIFRFAPGSSPTTNNGYFEFFIGRTANGMPDPRPDDGFQLGWNVSGAAAGAGYTELSFESHCSDATGCLDGVGQSETYFAMDNGNGTQIRPFGMFISANQSNPNTQILMNFDDLRMSSRSAATEILAVSYSSSRGLFNFGDSKIIADTDANKDFLALNGVPVISVSTDSRTGLVFGSGGSSISLSPGGDGSGVLYLGTNNVQFANGTIYDGSAAQRLSFQAGSAAAYPSMSIGGGEIGLKPAGSNTNIGTRISSKGNSDLTIDSTDAGTGNIVIQADGSASSELRLRTRNLAINNETDNGYRQGTSATGTSCTITRITHGIVTAATCS